MTEASMFGFLPTQQHHMMIKEGDVGGLFLVVRGAARWTDSERGGGKCSDCAVVLFCVFAAARVLIKTSGLLLPPTVK